MRKNSSVNENETRYRELVELAVDGILLGTHEGIITEANEYMCSIVGMKKKDIIGKHISFLPFSQESINKNPLRFDLLQKGEIVVSERVVVRPDASELVVEMRTKMMPDGTYHSIYRDITERKKAENALKESEETFRQLFEDSADSVMLLDNIVFVDCNAAALRLIGYSNKEGLVGKNPWKISPKYQPDGLLSDEKAKLMVAAAYAQGYNRFEWEHLKADGTSLPVEVVLTSINLHGKQILHVVLRDMTEKQKLMNHVLQTQKLESLGVLAGGIAHDFNNLLGGIFGYIDLAATTSKNPDTSKYLSKALNALDRARNLTRQLLTFAKGGAPAQRPDLLMPFIQETAQFALSGSSVSCRFDIPDNVWLCNFDRNQIAQVIDNLVINAQQAMPMGGIIHVSARNIPSGDEEQPVLGKVKYVAISVKDTGIGISKEILPRIFDPFFTTKKKGHGLGLASCYSIVTQHGGIITVESEPGSGSVFTIYLPAAEDSFCPASGDQVLAHKGGGRILVMDDEELIRDTMCGMLTTLGYTVICASDGAEAIALVKKESDGAAPFTAMIFDLTVPGGMGGEKAVTELRKMNVNIPIFVASGYADSAVMASPEKYGFTGSISKPFMINELVSLLNRYLGH